MAKYVKKPIPITAIQWTGENHIDLAEFTIDFGESPRF